MVDESKVSGDVLFLARELAKRAALLPVSPQIERLQRAIFAVDDRARALLTKPAKRRARALP